MSEPIVVVSADCHAGAPIHGYREYLEQKWWAEFDEWAATFVNPMGDLDEIYSDRNWDSAKRLRHLEEDGIAGEVVYPNTVPPFFRSNGITSVPPSPADYERSQAGIRAHNRWLRDFCSDAPGRRAGIAQVLVNDPVDAIAEITWARENGLFGGVLLPAIPPGSVIPPIWDARYERIWAACADLDVPINHHGGSGTPDSDWGPGMPRLTYLLEFAFYSNRSLWHLAWAGVFERHPRLRYVMTEQGFGEILDQLPYHEGTYGMLKSREPMGPLAQGARELVGDYINSLEMSPVDTIKRNCWLGASFMSAADAARRHEIGIDRVMWGADYPHSEGTWPNSRSSLATALAGVGEDDARRIAGLNAVEFYGFDLEALRPVANRIGPSPEEILVAAA